MTYNHKYAVNTTIVFHIMQKLNWAVDMARKQELQKTRKENNEELIGLMNFRQKIYKKYSVHL